MKTTPKFNLRMVLLTMLTGLCLALTTAAQAQTYYTNTLADYWSVPGNWTAPNGQPFASGSLDSIVVLSNSPAGTFTNDLAGAFMLNQLISQQPGTNSLYAQGGSSLLFTNSTAGTMPVLLQPAGGSLKIASPVTLGTNLTVTVTSPNAIYLGDGNITESAPSKLTKTGSGTLFLSGANSFSGGVTVSAGYLNPVTDGCLGTGLLTLATTGGLQNSGDVTLTNTILQNWGATFWLQTNTTMTLLSYIGTNGYSIAMKGTKDALSRVAGTGGTLVFSNAILSGPIDVVSNTLAFSGTNVLFYTNTSGYILTGQGDAVNNNPSFLTIRSNAQLIVSNTVTPSTAYAHYWRGTINVDGVMMCYPSAYQRNYQIININKGGWYTNSGNLDSGGVLNVAGTCYIGTYFNLTGIAGNKANVLDGGTFTAGGAVNLTIGTGNEFNVYSNGVANVLGNLTIITSNTNRVAGFEYVNQINSSGGEIRLSDGTTAGTLLLSNGIAPIVANTLRFVGGSPSMSTLIVSNSVPKDLQAAVQLGGAGVNENNLRLIKENGGTLSMYGVNSYTGDTIVRAGTLQFISAPATNSTVYVTHSGTNGVLQLSFSTTNVAKALVVNGTPATTGVHNATTDPGVITGAGSLLVLTGPSPVSSNANLTGLTLSPAAALSPAFAQNTTSYTASVAYGSLLAVTATNADLTATNNVTINGTSLGVVASGVQSSPAQALPANPAAPNVVTVQVTAQDGITLKTYTVNVTQLPSQTPPAVSNTYNSGTGVLTLNWPLANLGYRLLTQTNNLAGGVSASLSDWGAVPGSQATNTLSISATNRNEFFQLVYP